MEELMNLGCLHERCEDCPHWNGKECDGDLQDDEGQE